MAIIALLFFMPFLFDIMLDHISDMMQTMVMGVLLAAFFFVSLFVWSEQAYDERDEVEQLQMNKWAFIMGGMSIILLIIYQSFIGGVDIALPIILFVMLGTKLAMKNYYRLRDNGYIK